LETIQDRPTSVLHLLLMWNTNKKFIYQTISLSVTQDSGIITTDLLGSVNSIDLCLCW